MVAVGSPFIQAPSVSDGVKLGFFHSYNFVPIDSSQSVESSEIWSGLFSSHCSKQPVETIYSVFHFYFSACYYYILRIIIIIIIINYYE